jgi:hypothetical protein
VKISKVSVKHFLLKIFTRTLLYLYVQEHHHCAADGGVVTTTPSRMFVIPLQASPSDFSVSGECFTGPQQIKWIGQLGKMPFKFVLRQTGDFLVFRDPFPRLVFPVQFPCLVFLFRVWCFPCAVS